METFAIKSPLVLETFIKELIFNAISMNKQELKEIIIEQNTQASEKDLIVREAFDKVESLLKNPFVIIISGIRRSGKSTILRQLKSEHNGYYLNFDDDRLINFKVDDFQLLYETFIELYGEKDIWVRPVSMFLETVAIDDKMQPRFKLMK